MHDLFLDDNYSEETTWVLCTLIFPSTLSMVSSIKKEHRKHRYKVKANVFNSELNNVQFT